MKSEMGISAAETSSVHLAMFTAWFGGGNREKSGNVSSKQDWLEDKGQFQNKTPKEKMKDGDDCKQKKHAKLVSGSAWGSSPTAVSESTGGLPRCHLQG